MGETRPLAAAASSHEEDEHGGDELELASIDVRSAGPTEDEGEKKSDGSAEDSASSSSTTSDGAAAEPGAATSSYTSPTSSASAPSHAAAPPPSQQQQQQQEQAAANSSASSSTQVFGMLLVLASTFAFSVMSLFASLLGGVVPSLQTNAIRFVIQALLTLLAITGWHAREPGALRRSVTWIGKREQWWRLAKRGLYGVGGMGSFFYALQTVSLADATALVFTNVPLTAIFARLLLKEPYTLWDAGTAVVCFGGVLLVSQPPALFGAPEGGGGAREIPWYVVVVTFFGSCCSAMAYITIRTIGPGVDPLVVVLWFSLVGTLCAPLLAVLLQDVVSLDGLSGKEVAFELLIGVFGWVGQLLLNRGIALAPAGPATVMRYADLVFALIFQSFLLGTPPGAVKLAGALLILSSTGGAYMKARKNKRTAMEQQKEEAVVGEEDKGGRGADGHEHHAGEGEGVTLLPGKGSG